MVYILFASLQALRSHCHAAAHARTLNNRATHTHTHTPRSGCADNKATRVSRILNKKNAHVV